MALIINENPKAFRNWDAAVVRIYEILRQLNSGSGGTGLFGSTYFVAPEGDDSTGTVGSLSNPWKTISAARNQAVADGLSSSLIYVWPGVYDETELQYQDGKMYLSAGVLLQPSAKINGSTGLSNVVSINQVEKEFRFLGNWQSYLEVGKKFEILGGGAKDGKYTIVSALNTGPNTSVVVEEAIPDAIISGYLRNTEAIFILGADPLNAPATSYSTKFDLYGEGDINIVESADGDWSKGVGTEPDELSVEILSANKSILKKAEFKYLKIRTTASIQLLNCLGSSLILIVFCFYLLIIISYIFIYNSLNTVFHCLVINTIQN